MLGAREGNDTCQLPHFQRSSLTCSKNQYEQICFPFAPNIMQTFVFMLPLCIGCSLLTGGNQVIPCPWGSEEILLKPHMLCPAIQCTAVIINPVQLLSSNEPWPGTCHNCASASSHWCIAATTCHTQLGTPTQHGVPSPAMPIYHLHLSKPHTPATLARSPQPLLLFEDRTSGTVQILLKLPSCSQVPWQA